MASRSSLLVQAIVATAGSWVALTGGALLGVALTGCSPAVKYGGPPSPPVPQGAQPGPAGSAMAVPGPK
jgi:hypothetical protein